MKVQQLSKRTSAILVALLFLAATAMPIVTSQTASAYTLLGEREIRMSTSEPDATAVSYQVDFDVATTDDIGGVVVAFCEGSPIIGDTTCDVPAGFDLGSASVSGAAAGDVDLSGFTPVFNNEATAGANDNTLELTNATASTGITVGNSVQFTIDDVVNPTAVGSFYARIMVYSTEALAQGYTLADINSPEQAGGIALSTADQITIQAKVQERIEFCVYTSAPDYSGCGAVNATDPVILGDVNGVLSSVNPSVSVDGKYNITTNASAGATIRFKGGTLETGSFSIDALGGTATASSPNSEQFGMCTYRDTGGGVAGLTAVAPYNDANCSSITTTTQASGADQSALFAFDTTESATTYGDVVATKTAGDWSTGRLVFLGNIDNITEPGIYTTTLDFIATGRY